ncbi:bifunctional biotin--[acetyl-CoA-carboxylase] ligase/biotin operon repressor BirA [Methylococcus sp. EFPC2]|uniref:bifunctional biotin--[acetyl-CoA-carboxylase] ligase/biotin operon repressor BirA n=1 Tax=Methylococcus sp. EFPC2 TaxID=2812648 RepID=UPI001967061F|nr:bifunctional biotin--[acetyl-CoA-carboxylase] ligase/biotin operon repressor BirA [Methylococcus sp. EFPC2]QSA97675.1 bifunctional biotin--[acetyl-CoA-carboxylase] ligase/biotin operon repressor BirA [Methylococcus sp. EFPC2]
MHFHDRHRILIECLADGRFHSGSHLATDLGLSRAGVWGLIRELGELGLEVHAVHGKGYRLAEPLELLDENFIRGSLSESARRWLAELEIHPRLDSTNTHLANRARRGAPSGAVCLAESQSAGKGRLGRTWLSPFGGGIALSVLWRYDDIARLAGLSLAVGVAVMRALGRMGVEGAGLKWPNDILWRDRKLGGILLEASGEAHGGCAVVIGLGLNLHIPAESGQAIDQAWVDLRQIDQGIAAGRNRLVASLLDELLGLLADFGQAGLSAYLDEWRSHHSLHGRPVSVQLGDSLIHGRVAGVSAEGLLLVDDEDGARREFAAGDVRVRVAHV